MRIKHLFITAVISAAMVFSGFAPLSSTPEASMPADIDTGISSVYASTGQVNCKSMYKAINKFRTKKKVWQWKKGSKKKKYFNTKKSNKLKALKRDKSLEETAKKRAKELAKCYDHVRPNGKDCFSIYPKKFRCLGENIACGQQSVSEVMEDWIEEDETYYGQGHRRNMLYKHFKKVGVACYEYKGYKYWVQCFGG